MTHTIFSGASFSGASFSGAIKSLKSSTAS
ncbi:pentapeptide repeat-containing protein [Endozoicomonas euniceicola]